MLFQIFQKQITLWNCLSFPLTPLRPQGLLEKAIELFGHYLNNLRSGSILVYNTFLMDKIEYWYIFTSSIIILLLVAFTFFPVGYAVLLEKYHITEVRKYETGFHTD